MDTKNFLLRKKRELKNFLLRKKRGLCSNSMDGDDRKRPHQASSFDYSISKAANNGEVFEALQSDDCVAILCNCMKKLDQKMNELFQITSSTKDSQIKSKLQLKDLNETVNFTCR